MPVFGTILARELVRAELSQRAFAAATRTPLSTINAVISGTRKPPKKRLAGWATALRLTGGDRDRFLVSGFLAHAPAEIVSAVERLTGGSLSGRKAAEPVKTYDPS